MEALRIDPLTTSSISKVAALAPGSPVPSDRERQAGSLCLELDAPGPRRVETPNSPAITPVSGAGNVAQRQESPKE